MASKVDDCIGLVSLCVDSWLDRHIHGIDRLIGKWSTDPLHSPLHSGMVRRIFTFSVYSPEQSCNTPDMGHV